MRLAALSAIIAVIAWPGAAAPQLLGERPERFRDLSPTPPSFAEQPLEYETATPPAPQEIEGPVTPRWVWAGVAGAITAAASFYGTVQLLGRTGTYYDVAPIRPLALPGTTLIPLTVHGVNGSTGRLRPSLLASAGVWAVSWTFGPLVPLTPVIQVPLATWIEVQTSP